jgi:hypothetical protein
MTISVAIPSQCIALILMVVGYQRIGRNILDHLRRKETQGPSIRDPPIQLKRQSFKSWLQSWLRPIHSEAPYYIYHDSEANHRTKDCPIYLNTKWKMEQDTTQPSQEPPPREVNHTMQWTPNHHQYAPTYPLPFPPQTHESNQVWPPAYYQSYHYATTNHPPPRPTPQITYPPPVPQITYPTQNNQSPSQNQSQSTSAINPRAPTTN